MNYPSLHNDDIKRFSPPLFMVRFTELEVKRLDVAAAERREEAYSKSLIAAGKRYNP